MSRTAWAIAGLGALALALGCGGKTAEVRYYQLAMPRAAAMPEAADAVVVLEPLSTDSAYDDERIVYRTSPYRLDYYQYHHWISSPGTMVSDYLAQALAHTGRFRMISREMTDTAAVVLGGRVIAIEEVDTAPDRWEGRIALELTLTDSRTGAPVWSQTFDEREPLPAQTPEGLAAALSRAMSRIVARVAPSIADTAGQQARLRLANKFPMANRAPPAP